MEVIKTILILAFVSLASATCFYFGTNEDTYQSSIGPMSLSALQNDNEHFVIQTLIREYNTNGGIPFVNVTGYSTTCYLNFNGQEGYECAGKSGAFIEVGGCLNSSSSNLAQWNLGNQAVTQMSTSFLNSLDLEQCDHTDDGFWQLLYDTACDV